MYFSQLVSGNNELTSLDIYNHHLWCTTCGFTEHIHSLFIKPFSIVQYGMDQYRRSVVAWYIFSFTVNVPVWHEQPSITDVGGLRDVQESAQPPTDPMWYPTKSGGHYQEFSIKDCVNAHPGQVKCQTQQLTCPGKLPRQVSCKI